MADERDKENGLSEQPVKRKRGQQPGTPGHNQHGNYLTNLNHDKAWLVKEEERKAINARLLNETLEMYMQEPVRTDEELIERLGWYFKRCAERESRPTVEEMWLSTGHACSIVRDWLYGVRKPLGDYTVAILKKAQAFMQSYDAGLVASGALNPVVYIFRAKNYYGMKDQQDLTVNAAGTEPERSVDELSSRYDEAGDIGDFD